jgi:defect in organelle trafficking protein DotC
MLSAGMSKISIIGVVVLLLAGCARQDKLHQTSSLTGLQKMSFGGSKIPIGAIRMQALRDTALSVGARGGLAWRASKINEVLIQHENMLFRIFNFNAMLLDKNVLPPVLTEARNTLTLGGTDTIRIADTTYQIVNQAAFVTAPPTWRDYLWLSYTSPEPPDRSLLPKSRDEKLIWKKYTEEGWKAGIQQADLIFKENMARLKRDYEGMIRYRTLLAKNMVSPPYVAQMDMGITGGGSDLTVNDRILRITAFPMLQNDGQEWKTEITPHE